MTHALGEFLSRHKYGLEWLHIGAVAGALCVALPAVAWSGGGYPTASRALLIFLVATVCWSQNIGLVHHFVHRLPRGPRWLAAATARILNYLGGLPYTQIRFAHLLHHAHLGTPLDPDRAGYATTTTPAQRLCYLFLIGPLRRLFAPVDTAHAEDAMAPARRADHHRRCRRDWYLVAAAQLLLLALYGLYYPVVAAALIVANILSNAREMAEHGHQGGAAHVDIDVSPLGVLLLSTPGFWYHGTHHADAGIHYLDLPRASRDRQPRRDLPFVRRRSTAAFLITGR